MVDICVDVVGVDDVAGIDGKIGAGAKISGNKLFNSSCVILGSSSLASLRNFSSCEFVCAVKALSSKRNRLLSISARLLSISARLLSISARLIPISARCFSASPRCFSASMKASPPSRVVPTRSPTFFAYRRRGPEHCGHRKPGDCSSKNKPAHSP